MFLSVFSRILRLQLDPVIQTVYKQEGQDDPKSLTLV